MKQVLTSFDLSDSQNEIISYGKKLSEQGLVAANDGNISVLLSEKTFLITPTMMSKGEITADQLCLLDLSGMQIEGDALPSSEATMHSACYQKRSDVKAIIHAHPPYATALAATKHADTIGERILLPEILITTGRVGVVDYFTPGSEELAAAAAEVLSEHNAALLKNHGVITVGSTVQEAFYRLESIEMYCKVKSLAGSLGELNYLEAAEVEKILNKYHP